MNDLSVFLMKLPIGNISGDTSVNHLEYADDIVLLAPSAKGLCHSFKFGWVICCHAHGVLGECCLAYGVRGECCRAWQLALRLSTASL